MAVSSDSRYARSEVNTFRGKKYLSVPPEIDTSRRADDIIYTVQVGDTIEGLAHRFLGSVKHWWVIAIYNDMWLPLEPLEPGTVLRIPSYEHFVMDIL